MSYLVTPKAECVETQDNYAVLCAEHLVGEHPFAVLLADDLMVGRPGGPGVMAQMVDVQFVQQSLGLGLDHLIEMRGGAADEFHAHAEELVADIGAREHVVGFAVQFVDDRRRRAAARASIEER